MGDLPEPRNSALLQVHLKYIFSRDRCYLRALPSLSASEVLAFGE